MDDSESRRQLSSTTITLRRVDELQERGISDTRAKTPPPRDILCSSEQTNNAMNPTKSKIPRVSAATRPRRFVFAAVMLLSCGHALSQTNIVFETDTLRFAVWPYGYSRSLVDKTNNRELMEERAVPFASIQKDAKTSPSTSLTRDGDRLTAAFGATGISID